MNREAAHLVAEIIRDAGGEIVGRTRLQKTAYFLTVTGCGNNFGFRYRHFGPYSEEVAQAAEVGVLFGAIREKEKVASWGGHYSIYSVEEATDDPPLPDGDHDVRCAVARLCANAGAIALELAATAVFLSKDGYQKPWRETELYKFEKAQRHLPDARKLIAEMGALTLLQALPDNVL